MPLGGKGPATVACLWSEAVIAGAFVGLRWYTRKFLKGNIGVDDYVLMITWVLQCLFVILFTISALYGFGHHVSALKPEEIKMATKVELVGQFTVAIAMGLSKTAVALFLARIINVLWHKLLLWFWIVSMMALSLLLAISCFAQCYPVEAIWDASVKVEACPLNLTMIAYVMCSWSAAMDFFLALFPWYFLWKVNMKKKEKITICVSLSLGVFAGTAGIIRTTGLGVLSETADYLYATADSVMWTSSELCVTIICVSIPALRPLWSRTTGHGSASGYHKNTGDSTPICTGDRKGSKMRSLKTDEEGYELGTLRREDSKTDDFAAQNTPGARFEAQVWPESDYNSDKSILGRSQANAIQRTQEFTVTYSS